MCGSTQFFFSQTCCCNVYEGSEKAIHHPFLCFLWTSLIKYSVHYLLKCCWFSDLSADFFSSCRGHVCYMTMHLFPKVTQAKQLCEGGTSGTQSQSHRLNWGIFENLAPAGRVVCRMLKSSGVHRQLFQTEMYKRETKNRTRTPLSQLPLHCLWDCLCVSPLFSFKLPVFPPSLPPSPFSLFLSS